MIASYEDLVALLVADRVPHEPSPDDRSVRIPTRSGELEGVQLIRWQPDDGVVQLVQSLLADVPGDRLAAVADAAARLNHLLAWPGVDVNHRHRLLAFRVVLPLSRERTVEPGAIRNAFAHAVRGAAQLAPVLARVAAGELAPEDVVAAVRGVPTPHAHD